MATKFKELMKSYHFTQSYLSKISGVAQSNLSIYCNKIGTLEKSTMLTRLRLARAFNMELKNFEKYLNLPPATLLASTKQFGDFDLLGVE